MAATLGINSQRRFPQPSQQQSNFSNGFNKSQFNQAQQQQPRSVSQSLPLQYQHQHHQQQQQQQQQQLYQLQQQQQQLNTIGHQMQQPADESPMGSFGLPSSHVSSAAAVAAAASPKQGWRARQQEQQEQAALQQQQQMVQYELMKLQMFQQAQYFAQAQAQMALLSINNSQVNAAGHVVQVGQKPETRRSSPVQSEKQSPQSAAATAASAAAAKTLSANASAFKPASRSSSSADSGPSSPDSNQEHDLLFTPDHDLPEFISTDESLHLTPKESVPSVQTVFTASFPIRQPLGPPVAEVKDLGQLNFLCRNRRQIGGRLGGLMELAMGRQAILAH